jgi:hypothetical protein
MSSKRVLALERMHLHEVTHLYENELHANVTLKAKESLRILIDDAKWLELKE